MANVILNEEHLMNIANALREKNGLYNRYLPSEMASAIKSIQAGKQVKTGTTTSTTINTGLNSIDIVVIYANKIQSLGLMNTVYTGGGSATSVVCSAYSDYYKYCEIRESKDFQVSSGIFKWSGGSYNYDYFMTGASYSWIAVGE